MQELNLCHKEKERLSDELLVKSDLETVVHQLEQEKQRLSKKVESFVVTGKMSNSDSLKNDCDFLLMYCFS